METFSESPLDWYSRRVREVAEVATSIWVTRAYSNSSEVTKTVADDMRGLREDAIYDAVEEFGSDLVTNALPNPWTWDDNDYRDAVEQIAADVSKGVPDRFEDVSARLRARISISPHTGGVVTDFAPVIPAHL